jgi:hypothetical protein
MSERKWPGVLVALLACLIAGCGGDDDSATSGKPSGANPGSGEFLEACLASVEGKPDEEKIERPACQLAADSLDSCTEQAEAQPEGNPGREAAIKACEVAADKALARVSGGG